MDRSTYNQICKAVTEGALLGEAGKTYDTDATIILVEQYEAAVAFAKAKKIKRPPLVDEATPYEVKGKGPVAKKAPAKKAPARAAAPKTCTVKDCGGDHYSKGLCSRHYAAARRQDPAEREKANEASKAYYARQRAAAAKA